MNPRATLISGGRRTIAVLVILGAAVAGCATAPPGPRGPLLGRGVEVATDWSYAYGQGAATLPDGTTTSGGADTYWSPLTIFPRRLEGRLSPVSWMDVGGQIGWLGGGLDLRVGLPALDGRAWPVNLGGGFETGEVGPFKETKAGRSMWLRAEAYPLLPRRDGSLRLVLAAGVDVGTFHHELADPRPQTGFSDNFAAASVQTFRRETRLETSVGGFLYSGRSGSMLLTVSPYVVLDAGAPSSDCDGCIPLASYRQDWGVVVVTRFALRLGF